MTTLRGKKGVLKTFTFTYPSPRTNNFTASPVTLPTTESASGGVGTISWTVQAGDLPACDPAPFSMKYCAYVILTGKNNNAGAVTISYSIYKNGALVTSTTQAGIGAGLYWTQSHYRFPDVVEGDVLECRLWSLQSSVIMDYSALCVYPTRPEFTRAPIVTDLSFGMAFQYTLPSESGIAPVVAVGSNWNIYPMANAASVGIGNSATSTFTALCINNAANGYGGKIVNGDHTPSTGPQTNASSHPYYYRAAGPTVVSFREMW